VPARHLIHNQPARVVPRVLVLAAGVAQASDEEIERRGAFAPT
jgi:hypothetical protein